MYRNVFYSLLFIFFTADMVAQGMSSSFSSLSSPEKWWVIWHPFKARTAFISSMRTLEITDSIKSTKMIGSDLNGGKLDAFKHAYWMADLSKQIGAKPALKLGQAHEKGNYRDFVRGKKEDGYLPDKASSDMDLFNNRKGALLSEKSVVFTEEQMIREVITALLQGELKVIKKQGALFLDCNGKILQPSSILGTWENDKCLVPSNDP